MDNNINALNEINKGCLMGIESLEIILKKIEEPTFKELLEKQINEYQDISIRTDELYREYTNKDIDKTTTMEKAMLWTGIEKDTLLYTSITNIADLLIRGTNMGIVEGRKILNNKTLDKKVHKLCKEYEKMQEKYLNKLKEYL